MPRTNKAHNNNSIKHFYSQTDDSWVPLWGRIQSAAQKVPWNDVMEKLFQITRKNSGASLPKL